MPKPPNTLDQWTSFMGIDPGQSGGIATIAYGRPNHTFTIVNCCAMPKTERDVYEALLGASHSASMVAIESVHSMPSQGVASSFKFGQGYGFLRGCLVTLDRPIHDITPQRWQKIVGITPRKKTEEKRAFKQRIRAKAQQLFPKYADEITLATADAILIAYALCLQWEGRT